MTNKKVLKQLVDYSYVGKTLDSEKVSKVEKILKNNREYLKGYLKALKRREDSISIFIDIPMNDFVFYKNKFKNIFSKRKIIWNIDPSLVLGIRVREDDNVFEMSIKKSLENIISKIRESYD